jgi:hypothetical protein
MVWSLRGGGGPECWALVSQKRGFKIPFEEGEIPGFPLEELFKRD